MGAVFVMPSHGCLAPCASLATHAVDALGVMAALPPLASCWPWDAVVALPPILPLELGMVQKAVEVLELLPTQLLSPQADMRRHAT